MTRISPFLLSMTRRALLGALVVAPFAGSALLAFADDPFATPRARKHRHGQRIVE